MPQIDTQLAGQEPPEHRQFNAVVGRHVLETLGHPANLHRLEVRHLWAGCYRVNVVGVDAGMATIAHSFFLVTDGAGNIVTSTPEIRRRYGGAEG